MPQLHFKKIPIKQTSAKVKAIIYNIILIRKRTEFQIINLQKKI